MAMGILCRLAGFLMKCEGSKGSRLESHVCMWVSIQSEHYHNRSIAREVLCSAGWGNENTVNDGKDGMLAAPVVWHGGLYRCL